LVEHRALYATYGKVHGRFLNNQTDNWHSTWQLAVTMAEAMNKYQNQEREEEAANFKRRGDSGINILKEAIKEGLSNGYPDLPRRKNSIVTQGP
jgi:hypothetical protein